jgi:hypothetical protein
MNVRTKTLTLASVLALAMAAGGCGDTSTGSSPSQIVIVSLQGGSGGTSAPTFGGTLLSDVITVVAGVPTVFDDFGQVSMDLHLKDLGNPGLLNTPSENNTVTFFRYHVDYRRADGRNTPGVDVPFPIDGAATFSVTNQGATFSFELVRHVAKQEAPLAALSTDPNVISTLATVTFYGKDQAGHNVAVSGTIQINFGNFADPT